MNKKIVIFTSLIAISILLTFGSVSATKPMEMSAILYCNAEVIDSWVAGNNEFSYRELVCMFTSGDILGNVERTVSIQVNQLLNSANGPILPWFIGTVQQIFYVTDAEVTIGDNTAVGSFVIKANGKIGNVNWRIISSEVTVDGEPAILNGNGKIIINYVIPTSPTIYIIENTLTGQISLS